ncbi:MAG TPA: FUSC family protein, partial [Terrimicrobiaceae bacterium]
VFIYKSLGIPHGYWLGLTLVVVMQPDYGSTRQRAGERVLGTLFGSLFATGVLFLHLPHAVLLGATALTAFLFALFLKRRYDIAVIFLTVMVVLLTETGGPVGWRLTVERLACTLAGGGLAVLAAHLFWPAWERDRFQPLMKEALLASCSFIKLLCARLRDGSGRGPELIPAKRRLETANGEVFASLRRMYGDPKNRADILEDAAAMANGNLRLTRLLSVLLLHLTRKPAPLAEPMLSSWEEAACSALQVLAESWEKLDIEAIEVALARLEAIEFPSANPPENLDAWVFTQLARASTELSAMLIDALPDAKAPDSLDQSLAKNS